MKQATKAITDILTACGCKPAATVNQDGDIIIKVNAPTVTRSDDLPDFTSAAAFFCEPD